MHWISGGAKGEGEEDRYEDQLSCLEDLLDQVCEDFEGEGEPLREVQWLDTQRLGKIVTKCELSDFAANSEHMQWLQSQNKLDHHHGNTDYAGKQRQWQQNDDRLA
jgi:hypothetical protein